MPSPSSPSTFQRPDLGLAYEQFDLLAHMQGFVGFRVFTPVRVAVASGNYSKVELAQLLNDDLNVKRAPGAPYARGTSQFKQASFACSERGAEEPLDDRERAIYGYTGVRFEQLAADRATSRVLRNAEIEIATAAQTTSGSNATGAGTAWSTHANATPVKNVLAARESFRSANGFYPNAIVIPAPAVTHLRQCEEFQDYIKYGGAPGIDPVRVDESALAQMFQIPNVIIAGAVKNTKPGTQTPSLTDIWTSSIVTLLQVAQTEDLKEPAMGRTFMFQDLVLEQYRDESVRGDVIRSRIDLDVSTIHGSLSWQLTGCL